MPLLSTLGSGIFDLIFHHGILGLAAIMAIEEAGIPLPIPGDLILAFAGSQIPRGLFSPLAAYLASVIGVSIGATFLYLAFRLGGRPFVYKYGKFILLPPDRVHHLEEWFAAHGKIAILWGRFIPGFRVFLSGIAGLVGLPYRYFLPQIIISSTLWIIIFMGAGFLLGERWANAASQMQHFGNFLFIIFIAVIIHFIVKNSTAKTPPAK